MIIRSPKSSLTIIDQRPGVADSNILNYDSGGYASRGYAFHLNWQPFLGRSRLRLREMGLAAGTNPTNSDHS
jgi:hypothetical protein